MHRSTAGPVRTFRALTAPLRLLMLTQLGFNIGFYLVVPFLAAYMENELRLTGAVIGAVLGLRTFSQQGMFFVGGAIADRWGVWRSIVIGCLVRIAGFFTLATATGVVAMVVGVVLVGLAAALFSPALESAVSSWGERLECEGGPSRTEIWALEGIVSQVGAIVGPLLGAVLLVVPFETTCVIAAGVFGLILLAQLVWLPRGSRASEHTSVGRALAVVGRNRVFLAFAVLHSCYLVSYNQLYLALPAELDRIGAPAAAISWYFLLAAVVMIVGAMPLARLARRLGPPRAFALGYLALACCFLPVAGFAPVELHGPARYLPACAFVALVHVGQMLVLPMARDIVGVMATGRAVGSYLGALSTIGGAAVLAGSATVGQVIDLAREPGLSAMTPWLVLALFPAVASGAVPALLRRHDIGLPNQPRPPGEPDAPASAAASAPTPHSSPLRFGTARRARECTDAARGRTARPGRTRPRSDPTA